MFKTDLTTALMFAQPLPEVATGAPVPEWVHLLPVGFVSTDDGRGPYNVDDMQAIFVQSFAADSRLVVDENHSTDIRAPQGEPAPAHGWITAMDARDDGIWGQVSWNQSGHDLLADRAYRGISPVIYHDAAGTVFSIARASLTNTPNLKGLTSLNSSTDITRNTDMSLFAKPAELLGLNATATEEEVMAAITAAMATPEEDTKMPALQSSLAAIGTAFGLADDAAPALIVAAAQASVADASTLVPALQSQVTTLSATVTALQETGKRTASEAFVDGAIGELRIGLNSANRAEFISMHMENPTRTEGLINGFPVMTPSGSMQSAADVAAQDGIQNASAEDITAKATVYKATQSAAGVNITMTQAILAVSTGAAK